MPEPVMKEQRIIVTFSFKYREYLAYVRERQVNRAVALLIYKYLEKKVNRAGKHFTTEEIVDTPRSMDFLSIAGEGYVPTYTRTDLTNHLHGSAGFRTDTQIVTRQKMRSIIAQTKKREKDEDDDK